MNEYDPCVYSKMIGSNNVIICLYVDNTLIFGTTVQVVNHVKTYLPTQFEMKDLGETGVILGVEIERLRMKSL